MVAKCYWRIITYDFLWLFHLHFRKWFFLGSSCHALYGAHACKISVHSMWLVPDSLFLYVFTDPSLPDRSHSCPHYSISFNTLGETKLVHTNLYLLEHCPFCLGLHSLSGTQRPGVYLFLIMAVIAVEMGLVLYVHCIRSLLYLVTQNSHN